MSGRKDRYRHQKELPGAREALHELLVTMTEVATEELKCSGVSVVTSTINLFATELGEFAPKEAAQMFRAIADMLDAGQVTEEMEKRRVDAVKAIFAKMDLLNQEPKGNV